jgi:hypothetical protein
MSLTTPCDFAEARCLDMKVLKLRWYYLILILQAAGRRADCAVRTEHREIRSMLGAKFRPPDIGCRKNVRF